jgi:phospholipid transport system transporter-binding protein
MNTGSNVVRVSGRLTIETAADWFSKGVSIQNNSRELVVDLAQVEAVDSSAVSLMLVWLRAAQSKNVKLSFINTPENLLSLASLYGVADSLPLHGASA